MKSDAAEPHLKDLCEVTDYYDSWHWGRAAFEAWVWAAFVLVVIQLALHSCENLVYRVLPKIGMEHAHMLFSAVRVALVSLHCVALHTLQPAEATVTENWRPWNHAKLSTHYRACVRTLHILARADEDS